jgi:hypothetical protein
VFIKVYSPSKSSFTLTDDLFIEKTSCLEDFILKVDQTSHFKEQKIKVGSVMWEDNRGIEGEPELKMVKNDDFSKRIFDGSSFVFSTQDERYFQLINF